MPTTTTISEHLLKRAAEYEEKARGLRLAAAEVAALNGHRVAKKREGLPAQLMEAIALREEQHPTKKLGRPKKAKKAKPKLPKGAFAQAAAYVLHQAKQPLSTEDLQARIYERLGTKGGSGTGLGSLIRYGYAKQTKEGWTGTGKEFDASKSR